MSASPSSPPVNMRVVLELKALATRRDEAVRRGMWVEAREKRAGIAAVINVYASSYEERARLEQLVAAKPAPARRRAARAVQPEFCPMPAGSAVPA